MKRPRFPAAPGKRNSRIMYPVATEQEQEEEEEGEEDLDISESSQYDESEHSPRQHDDPIGLITPEAIRDATRFSDLPLTEATASALRKCRYDVLTTIQRRSFPYSLSGYDVVGCARTGSGKTLSFLVPLLERLSGRAGDGIMWQRGMGLGALILTPTRELAVQIFETFRSVGRYHSHLSGGLATGGWSLEEEQRHIAGMSVLVATPGRMLQHLDQVADLELGNVSMLVMDEADRLLDDSFAHTIGNILEHLTSTARQRQTLLFSATLAPSIQFPPQLLLREQTVHYIAADTTSDAKASSVGGNTVTSVRLCQSFMVIPIDQKYSILYSFLVAHDRQKTIVFFATCHQAKFAFTVFSRLLRTHGVACAVLTGKMRQHQRAEVFQVCNQRTGALVLFCTDVASRGLDLPDIRWVVQFDCCDSPETYVHRVGRTARCGGKGSTLLMLLPSETDMLYYLDVAGVLGPRSALREVRLRSGRGNGFHVVDHLIAGEVARDAKPLAQRAYISYLRHVAQSEAKGVFRFDAIDREALARSMGLSSVPNEKVLNLQHRRIKNVAWEIYNATATTPSQGNDSDSVDSSEVEGTEKRRIPSRTEKKRKATHLQRELDRAGDLVKGSTFIWDTSRNTMEGGDEEDGDILELAGTVSGGHSKPLPRTVDSLSKKSQRLLKKRADVDIRVGTLGLSTRETFQDEED